MVCDAPGELAVFRAAANAPAADRALETGRASGLAQGLDAGRDAFQRLLGHGAAETGKPGPGHGVAVPDPAGGRGAGNGYRARIHAGQFHGHGFHAFVDRVVPDLHPDPFQPLSGGELHALRRTEEILAAGGGAVDESGRHGHRGRRRPVQRHRELQVFPALVGGGVSDGNRQARKAARYAIVVNDCQFHRGGCARAHLPRQFAEGNREGLVIAVGILGDVDFRVAVLASGGKEDRQFAGPLVVRGLRRAVSVNQRNARVPVRFEWLRQRCRDPYAAALRHAGAGGAEGNFHGRGIGGSLQDAPGGDLYPATQRSHSVAHRGIFRLVHRVRKDGAHGFQQPYFKRLPGIVDAVLMQPHPDVLLLFARVEHHFTAAMIVIGTRVGGLRKTGVGKPLRRHAAGRGLRQMHPESHVTAFHPFGVVDRNTQAVAHRHGQIHRDAVITSSGGGMPERCAVIVLVGVPSRRNLHWPRLAPVFRREAEAGPVQGQIFVITPRRDADGNRRHGLGRQGNRVVGAGAFRHEKRARRQHQRRHVVVHDHERRRPGRYPDAGGYVGQRHDDRLVGLDRCVPVHRETNGVGHRIGGDRAADASVGHRGR